MILPGVLVSAARTQNLQAADDGEVPLSQRITLAQIYVSRDVSQNTEHIRAAFARAKADDSQWILFPEGAVSGYHDDFDQIELTRAFDEIRELCQESRITGLIGTCRKDPEGVFNEIRVTTETGNSLPGTRRSV